MKTKKEVAETVDSIIDSKFPKKSRQLAKWYLSPHEDTSLPGMSVFRVSAMQNKLYEIISDKLSAHDKETEKLKRDLKNLPRKVIGKRLSKDVISYLKKKRLFAHIADALYDFDYPLRIAYMENESMKRVKMSANPPRVRNAYKKVVSNAEGLLSNPFFCLLSLSAERSMLENIRDRFKQWFDDQQPTTITPLQIMLLERESSASLLGGRDYKEWPQVYSDYLSTKVFQFPQGRPKDFIFKTIQIIIYRLLEDGSIEKKKAIEERTAQIINQAYREYYKTTALPILKAKDINNALHSA